MAVEGQSTKHIVLSMIPWSYCRRRRSFTVFVPEEMKLIERSDLSMLRKTRSPLKSNFNQYQLEVMLIVTIR